MSYYNAEPTVDIYGKPLAYLNNIALKSADQPLAYTKYQIEELIKCSSDIIYFAEKYYHIVHQDFGLINIKLRDYQKLVLNNFYDNRFNILKFPRQSGKCCNDHTKIYIKYKNKILYMNIGDLYNSLHTADKNSTIINKSKQLIIIGKICLKKLVRYAIKNLLRWEVT